MSPAAGEGILLGPGPSVIFISDADPELVSRFHMIPAGSIAQALEMADGILGRKDGMITVIPDGVGVCVY